MLHPSEQLEIPILGSAQPHQGWRPSRLEVYVCALRADWRLNKDIDARSHGFASENPTLELESRMVKAGNRKARKRFRIDPGRSQAQHGARILLPGAVSIWDLKAEESEAR
jgi:hypothetical protein